MSESSETKQRGKLFWPAAFFVLNAAALVLWFHWSGFFMSRELALRTVAPRGSEIDPASLDKVEVEFDSALDPETVGEDSLRFIPPLAGKSELANGGLIRFRLAEKPRPATAYRILWSPKIRGKYGQIAPQELVEFSTTRFAFVGARQTAFDRDSYTVELSFNQPIRSVDLEGALKGRFSLPDDDRQDGERVRVVTTGTALSHQVKVRESRASFVGIALPAGLAGTEGGLGLKDGVDLVWKLAGAGAAGVATPEWASGREIRELAPSLAYLGMSGDWEGSGGVVTVRMTAPLDIASAKEHVVIEPPLPVSFTSGWGRLRITGDFQPGKQYRVTLKPGLSAGDAGELKREISRNVWFDDLPPRLDFSFGGGYLRPEGLLKVPVTSVNLDRFGVTIRKLYPSNIVEAAIRDYAGDGDVDEDYAGPDKETAIKVARRPNQRVETLLDLRELAGKDPVGVYGLEIRQDDRQWHRKSATVVISDIGLAARSGRDQVLAWAVSLSGGKPLAGCAVKVYSNRRQLLAEGETGKDGAARLAIPPLPEGEKPILVIAEAGKEMTFVRLDRHQTPRGGDLASGAAYPGEYQAFVALDRGVYRAGETVKASVLVRDGAWADIPSMPVDLALAGRDGKIVQKTRGTTDRHGRVLADLSLPRDAAGGWYSVEARLPADGAGLGSASFRMADYIPETLRVSLSLPERPAAFEPCRLEVEAKRLAGGETGKLSGKVLVTYTPELFSPRNWPELQFGDHRTGMRARVQVERQLTTGEDGKGSVEWDNPQIETPAAARMTVRAEIMEPGGRVAAASRERVLHASRFYLGARVQDRNPRAGEAVRFFLAAVDSDGKAAKPVRFWGVKLYRVEYNGLLKRRDDGRLVYDWQRLETLEDEAAGAWADGFAEFSLKPARGGSYRLVAESPGGKAVTLDFTVSGDANGWTGEDPEALNVELTEKSHPVGSRAVARVMAPFAGQALVTIETDRVVKYWTKELAAGENELEIPVTGDMRPNAFVAVTLVRPAGAEAAWKPHRARGAARVEVDNQDRKLLAAIAGPETLAPGKKADIAVEVRDADGAGVDGATVVLWGVDAGVLSLTDFATPSPWEWFYRRRRLEVADADMFSRLAPELEEWRGGKDPAPGGDAAQAEFGRRLSPVSADRVKAAIIYQGDLTTDEKGKAAASFDIPEAATRLRLMAWVAKGDRMGSAERETEIRAPISVSSSWPRFAAPGDEFLVHATLLNRSGREAEAVLTAEVTGGLELQPSETRVSVPDNQARTVVLRAKAREIGVVRAVLTARLGEDSFRDSLEMPVRPPVLFQRLAGVAEVAAGGKKNLTLGEGLLPEGGRVKLVAGGSPQVKLANCLDYLVGYPYECAEQTSSRLAGLVAVPDLLNLVRPGQMGRAETAELAAACLARLAAQQNANGGFRMWQSSGDSVFWASAQILYILEECRAAGLEVPERLLAGCRSYLKDGLDGQLSGLVSPAATGGVAAKRGGDDAALACLALARGGDIRRSWLVRLVEIAQARAGAGDPLSASALAFLCEAVAAAGDPARAAELFDRWGPASHQSGFLRDPALAKSAWLSAGLRLGVAREKLAGLAAMLDSDLARNQISWNTRENAWVLMALGKYWRDQRPDRDLLARLEVGGKGSQFPALQGKTWEKLPPGVAVEAEARGGGSFYLTWQAEGVPASGRAVEEDVGLVARRRVFASGGDELAAPFVLKQGEVYEIRLEVEGEAGDLVLADLLPAGLEIEDPDLKGRSARNDDAGGLRVDQVERKDDRLLVFGALAGKGNHRYLCRAVTPGDYVWPALDAGRMYDSGVRSVHGEAGVKVEAAGGENR